MAREPRLDVFSDHGPGDRQSWAISCATCGWHIEGQGKRPESANVAARTHECPPE